MEPIEINAGAYYLRPLRADDRLDDRPAVLAGFADPETRRWVPHYDVPDLASAGRYVETRSRQWSESERCSWAVAEPTTGALLAETGLQHLDPHWGSAEVACWTLPAQRRRGILAAVLPTMLRFAFTPVALGGLGIHRVGYRHVDGNEGSRRLAERCGFRLDGRLREAALVDGQRRDLITWSRLATD